MCRSAGAIPACCSDRSRSLRCSGPAGSRRVAAASRRSQTLITSETKRPGDPVPVDSVPVDMRPQKRKRLPIGGAIITVAAVTMGIAPMPGSFVRGALHVRFGGFAGGRRCRRLGGLRCERRPRYARRRLSLRGGWSRRCGCVFRIAWKGWTDDKKCRDGEAGDIRFHSEVPLRKCFVETRLPYIGRRASCARSLRRGLGVHIDDLDAAVDRVHRCVRILWLVLAIADRDEIGAGDAVFLDEVALD
jgi:hypothetical protein